MVERGCSSTFPVLFLNSTEVKVPGELQSLSCLGSSCLGLITVTDLLFKCCRFKITMFFHLTLQYVRRRNKDQIIFTTLPSAFRSC